MTINAAWEAVKKTPEYKDWKKANNAYLEAYAAYLATPEYKAKDEAWDAWLKAREAKEEARKAWLKAETAFDEAKEAYWAAREAANKVWDVLDKAHSVDRAVIKALEATPEFKAYIKAGGACEELRRD